MNLNLAAYYEPEAGQEDLTKTAEAELFVKLAAQEGIDLSKMSDEAVSTLYNTVFSKTAEEEGAKDEDDEKDDDEDEKKKEAAAREHQTKLAYAKEAAQADDLGVRMARSYVAELNKIGSELLAKQAAAEAGETDKEAGVKDIAERAGKGLKRGLEHVQAAVSKKHGPALPSTAPSFGPKTRLRDPIGAAAEAGKKGLDFVKKHKETIGVGAGAASVGAGAGYAAGRKKESSAIDQLALEEAVKLAFDAGFDPEEAAVLVTSRFNLGLEESTKLASSVEDQVGIRALEYLESVGYPVTWDGQPQQ